MRRRKSRTRETSRKYFAYMKYLHVWNWTSLGKIIVSRGDYGKMIIFESITQRNALDQCSNNPSSDHADQWPGKSLSRVDLIDHWSQNGFAPKERHRSEILIRILSGERTRTLFVICNGRPRQDASDPEKFFINSANRNISTPKSAKWQSDKWSSLSFVFLCCLEWICGVLGRLIPLCIDATPKAKEKHKACNF